MEKDTHANANQNNAAITIICTRKVEFKTRNIIKDKSINSSRSYTILNVYAPNKKLQNVRN